MEEDYAAIAAVLQDLLKHYLTMHTVIMLDLHILENVSYLNSV